LAEPSSEEEPQIKIVKEIQIVPRKRASYRVRFFADCSESTLTPNEFVKCEKEKGRPIYTLTYNFDDEPFIQIQPINISPLIVCLQEISNKMCVFHFCNLNKIPVPSDFIVKISPP
jgi:hypothetical protein